MAVKKDERMVRSKKNKDNMVKKVTYPSLEVSTMFL